MKAYIICPARPLSVNEQAVIDTHTEQLIFEGWDVYNPRTALPEQNLTDRAQAMRGSDWVFVFWDASNASHFDLGMAFALGKKMDLLHIFDEAKITDKFVAGMKLIEHFAVVADKTRGASSPATPRAKKPETALQPPATY